ncbi:hypothetical protein [Rhodococcus xishaensis]|uniref:Uncharacterized protein n=1 Tax=Rhodococcus xishaensis TaxID=2487364 RepID=A0A3S3A4Q0_9NOCA|nr:hypothetical protein [Rhodococcus xishaensis]RVW01969.1 hypothetical protein EGT50_11010 [Rhodococcus xishaensis]
MTDTSPRRVSYEARILLVPLGSSGLSTVEQMASAGLTGVRVVTEQGASSVAVRAIDATDESTESLDDLVAASDMVILIGSRLPEVPVRFASAMADSARRSGNLLAGVLVDQQDWESSLGAEALAVLRMELDMLVSISQVSMATAFIDVLKGGYRTEKRYAPLITAGRN